jgi:hypothetical protein
METANQQFCHLWNCTGAVVRKAVLSVYGNGMLPFMEMVCYRLSSYLPCYATAYGNGKQPL